MTEARLRFAMVTTFYPPFNFGGDGIFIQRLAHALSRRGHSVDVIHDTDAFRMLSGNDPEIVDDDGIRVHRLRSRFPALSSLAVQQLGRPAAHAATLEKQLASGYDVINFHNISLVGGPGIWRYGDAVKLHTAHEHWLVCQSHILWRDNREICDERRCVRCALRHKRPPQAWRAVDLVGRHGHHVDAFLMLSEAAAANHRRFGFPHPMTVIPSFLPEEEAAAPSGSTDAENPDTPPYFLFVGRLEVIKGLQDVIPLFGNDMPAELWIAGAGDYEPELRRLAAGRANIKFLGRQPMDRLRTLYRNALAVVTPSVCYEVFPMVVLEAFREGTPIIARELGPYPEIVNATGAGLLFNDEASLKQALIRYAEEPALRGETRRKAASAFQEKWSEDVAMAAYFDVIRQAARKRGNWQLADRLDAAQG